MHRISAIAGFFLVLLAGCIRPTEPKPGSMTPAIVYTPKAPQAAIDRQKVPGLSTRVTGPARAIVSGGEIPLVLSLTNHGHLPDTLRFFDQCRLFFAVYDQHGNQVDGEGCLALGGGPLVLGPGETYQVTQSWFAHTYRDGKIVPLPTGLYRIYAVLAPHQGEQTDQSPPFVMRLVAQ